MIKQKIQEVNILLSYFSYILDVTKEEMESENISFMQVGTVLTCVTVKYSEIKKGLTLPSHFFHSFNVFVLITTESFFTGMSV